MNRSPSVLHHASLRPIRRTSTELESGFDVPDSPSAGSSSLHYQEPRNDLQSSFSPPLSDPEMTDSRILQDMSRVTLSGYHLSTMAILVGFGTLKALESLRNDNIAVTWIEWVGGGLITAIWYYVGLYEELDPPVAPWFFHEDYTLDCFYVPLGAIITALLNTYFWFSLGVSLGLRNLLGNIYPDQEKSFLAYTLFMVRFCFYTSIVISTMVVKLIFCVLVPLWGILIVYGMWWGVERVLGRRHRRRFGTSLSNGFDAIFKQYRARFKRHVWLYVTANVVVLAANMPWAISMMKNMLPPIHRD